MEKLLEKRDVRPLPRETIRLLHLEDSPEDAELVQNILACGGLECRTMRVSNKSGFEEALIGDPFDLVLCDHNIVGYSGFEALIFAKQLQPHTPVIILSGALNDDQAVESLRSGATDYILKDKRARLVPAVRRALVDAKDRKEQAVAQEQIRQQARLLDLTQDAIVVRTVDGAITFWNKGAEVLFGWRNREALGENFGSLVRADGAIMASARDKLLLTGTWAGELTLFIRYDDKVAVFRRLVLVLIQHGEPDSILCTNSDVTEKKRLEAIFLRAQRMDGIGALAGGIAHDLDNALAPVLMSAEVLKLSGSPEQQRYLNVISTGTLRATGMVKQILRFSRGGTPGLRPVAVGRVVDEMQRIIENTFPKSIRIQVDVAKNLRHVRGDATELHQLLLNLCVNARDAMANQGKLTITASNVVVDEEAALRPSTARRGRMFFCRWHTGCGIPPSVLPRIFEPFFTTKTEEKGHRARARTVVGIVKHHGGCMDVKTVVDEGTAFQVYLPADAAPAPVVENPAQSELPFGNGEVILVIDDEAAIRDLTKSTLKITAIACSRLPTDWRASPVSRRTSGTSARW